MICLITGPMFSGKSTELSRQIRRHHIAGKKCLSLKYEKDIRFSDTHVMTHDGIKLNLRTILVSHLNKEIENICLEYDVISIDECQFMKGLTHFCDKLANKGKTIICAGLDADFNRNVFLETTSLIPKCEDIIKLKAVCKCGKDASFSKIKIKSDTIEHIGGSEIYESVCRICYFE